MVLLYTGSPHEVCLREPVEEARRRVGGTAIGPRLSTPRRRACSTPAYIVVKAPERGRAAQGTVLVEAEESGSREARLLLRQAMPAGSCLCTCIPTLEEAL
jgi:hypothetical protein